MRLISTRFCFEEIRRLRGETVVRQEFEWEFAQSGKTLLHAEDVDALFESPFIANGGSKKGVRR